MQYKNRQGEEITREQWMALTSDPDYRTIGQTTVGDYWVSTVWLGMAVGDQLVFETMVFPITDGEVSYDEVICERYVTEADAEQGHADVVAHLKRGGGVR